MQCCGMPGNSAARRINKEIENMQKNTNEHFSAGPAGENMYEWTGMLMSVPGPYEGGIFNFSISFPPDYPFKRPKIVFTTKVYHPNVSDKGEVCEQILGEWAPSMTVINIVETLYSMFADPTPDNAVNPDIARLLKDDRSQFDKNAREWTRKYAQ